jgi:hypothetical protein
MTKLLKHAVRIILIIISKNADHAMKVAIHVLEINQITVEHVFQV